MPLPDKNPNGQYPAFTSIGSYTILYVTKKGDVLCAACSSKPDLEDPAFDADVYFEGPPLDCEECGEKIESAYGETT